MASGVGVPQVVDPYIGGLRPAHDVLRLILPPPPRGPRCYYATSRTLTPPSRLRHTTNGSSVVGIDVGRGGGGGDDGARWRPKRRESRG
jgi:hypothetical protein